MKFKDKVTFISSTNDVTIDCVYRDSKGLRDLINSSRSNVMLLLLSYAVVILPDTNANYASFQPATKRADVKTRKKALLSKERKFYSGTR